MLFVLCLALVCQACRSMIAKNAAPTTSQVIVMPAMEVFTVCAETQFVRDPRINLLGLRKTAARDAYGHVWPIPVNTKYHWLSGRKANVMVMYVPVEMNERLRYIADGPEWIKRQDLYMPPIEPFTIVGEIQHLYNPVVDMLGIRMVLARDGNGYLALVPVMAECLWHDGQTVNLVPMYVPHTMYMEMLEFAFGPNWNS
jgi:hypothetical protein